MNDWQRWVRHPQNLWLRRAVFQVHLWTGIALGLYVVMLSVTGSALVYRVEMSRAFLGPTPTFDASRRVLSADELKAAAERVYPGWGVTFMGTPIARRAATVVIVVERTGERKERRFDLYTGVDLGDVHPLGVRALTWLAALHDDLLFGSTGRTVNGVGSALVLLLALSGAIVWWPGVKKWRRSLLIRRTSSWSRFNWELHSAMGVWFFLILVLWCISGVYFAFPEMFTNAIDRVWGPERPDTRPGDVAIEWMVRLHFGRFRNAPYLQPLWVAAGLAPLAMVVTGAVMWWNRKLRKRPRRSNGAVNQAEREVA